MNTTELIFAAIRAGAVSALGGLIFWLVLRKFKGISPGIHRLCWLGVLLLGICVFRLPIDIPYYDMPEIAQELPHENVEKALDDGHEEDERLEVVSESRPYQPLRNPETINYATNPFDFSGLPARENSVQESEELIPAGPTVISKTPEKPYFSAQKLILTVWAVGFGLLLLRRAWLFGFLHLRLRRLECSSAVEWENLLKQFGIASEKIPVMWTDNAGPGLVRSIFSYRLIFPRSLWEELSPAHREGVLRHELAHYLGGDASLMEISRLLATLQWFNPISWVALRKLEEATEWRCDDFAYFNRESGPRELIETLLAVHESTESLGLYLSSFARISVIHRINRLLHIQPRKENTLMKKFVLTAMFVALLAGGLIQLNLVAKPQPPKTPEPVVISETKITPTEIAEETPEEPALTENVAENNEETAEKTLGVALEKLGKDQFEVVVKNGSGKSWLVSKNLVSGFVYAIYDPEFKLVNPEALKEEENVAVGIDDFGVLEPGETIRAKFSPELKMFRRFRAQAFNPAPQTLPVSYFEQPYRYANLPAEYYISVAIEYCPELRFFMTYPAKNERYEEITSQIPPKAEFLFHIKGGQISECSPELLKKNQDSTSGLVPTPNPGLTKAAESLEKDGDVRLDEKPAADKTTEVAPETMSLLQRSQAVLMQNEPKLETLHEISKGLAAADKTLENPRIAEGLYRYSIQVYEKIMQFEGGKNSREDEFLVYRKEICEFLEDNPGNDSYLGLELVQVAEILNSEYGLSREEMLETYRMTIAALQNRGPDRVRERMEAKLSFHHLEGKTIEITGKDIDGQEFDLNWYRGKNVLFAFTSSRFGGPEMPDVNSNMEVFEKDNFEAITFVALNKSNRGATIAEEMAWLRTMVKNMNYPGIVLTELNSPEIAIQKILGNLNSHEHGFNLPHFIFLAKNGKVTVLSDETHLSIFLIERYGMPDKAALERAGKLGAAYYDTPKTCEANLGEIMLAMHAYHDIHDSFPPAYTVDENGNKLHSWRVLLLPYFNDRRLGELHKQIRLEEPWDSEHNQKIAETRIPLVISATNRPLPVCRQP